MQKRNLASLVIFSIITLGIYLLVWFVKTKNEMKGLGADIPTAWLIIVPFGNIYWLYKYCDAFSNYVKKDNMGIIWFLLSVTMFPALPIIIQSEINKTN